jgi:uncharacterized protein
MPNPASTLVGEVEELWRYPVKSMLGKKLTTTDVTEKGLLGDRAYALRDTSDGKIATAKNPRKWPNLFDYEAALTGAATAGEKLPPALITLPDCTSISAAASRFSRSSVPSLAWHQNLSGPCTRFSVRKCLRAS